MEVRGILTRCLSLLALSFIKTRAECQSIFAYICILEATSEKNVARRYHQHRNKQSGIWGLEILYPFNGLLSNKFVDKGRALSRPIE